MCEDGCHPQVVLQVVIAFIVDAFMQQNNRKEIKKKEMGYVVDDADCIEGISVLTMKENGLGPIYTVELH